MTKYRVYGNSGSGGPVNLATPVATGLTALTWTTPALALNSDNTFLVRPYDDATGYENENQDATVRIVIDGAGADVTGRPGPAALVRVRPTAGASLAILWAWGPGRPFGTPTAFDVWWAAGAINYGAAPNLTVDLTSPSSGYTRLSRRFRAATGALTPATLYTVGVRARNAVGSAPAIEAQGTTDAAGPPAVTSLTAAATPSGPSGPGPTPP